MGIKFITCGSKVHKFGQAALTKVASVIEEANVTKRASLAEVAL
jgi:hypothetical protein